MAGDDILGAVCDRASDDVAVIVFTSGTTGRPKGAELTVGNLLSAGDISARMCGITPDDRVGTGLPLFHVFGQTAVLMSALTAGATMSLLARFTAKAMLDMLRRDRLTIMCGVPTMWNAMLHDAGDATAADFAQLRLAVSGGASLPAEVARAFQQKFGCSLARGLRADRNHRGRNIQRPCGPARDGRPGGVRHPDRDPRYDGPIGRTEHGGRGVRQGPNGDARLPQSPGRHRRCLVGRRLVAHRRHRRIGCRRATCASSTGPRI